MAPDDTGRCQMVPDGAGSGAVCSVNKPLEQILTREQFTQAR